MRFSVVALSPETADIQTAVARLVAPYDQSLPAPPYKKYLSEQDEQLETAVARIEEIVEAECTLTVGAITARPHR